MRGTDERSGKLFSYVDLEQRVPAGHPLRAIRGLVNEALTDFGPELEVALACHLEQAGNCDAATCLGPWLFTGGAR